MATYGLDERSGSALEREVLELFTALLRVDTTNGNETDCAHGPAGLPRGERHRRASSTASCPTGRTWWPGWTGDRPGPTLTMMGHLDVVPADAGEWSVPPFAGVVKDGFVWGCGATDMKNQVAAEAVALARLKRSGADFAGTSSTPPRPTRRTASSAACSGCASTSPDALRCDYLLNEGMGGLWLPVDGRKVFLLAVGEKAFAQFRIRTRGRGGHGSVPEKERSAVIDLARAVIALGLADPPAIVSATTARFIDVLVARRETCGRASRTRHGARRRRRAARRSTPCLPG